MRYDTITYNLETEDRMITEIEQPWFARNTVSFESPW